MQDADKARNWRLHCLAERYATSFVAVEHQKRRQSIINQLTKDST
jgi:hypothetical protein